MGTQSESPEAFLEVHLEIIKVMREIFTYADPIYGWVPMYPSGWWSWTFASMDKPRYKNPIAKRAEKEKHEGAENYREALDALNDGEYPYDIARFIGLESKTESVGVHSLKGKDSIVAWSNSHAIFVDEQKDGHVSDHYGEEHQFDGTDTNAGRNFTRLNMVRSSPVTQPRRIPTN